MRDDHPTTKYVTNLDGFAAGDIVSAAGWSNRWVVAEIMIEDDGLVCPEPFRLRSAERNESEGYPTRYGTILFNCEDDRYIWIWASAANLTLETRPNANTEMPA